MTDEQGTKTLRPTARALELMEQVCNGRDVAQAELASEIMPWLRALSKTGAAGTELDADDFMSGLWLGLLRILRLWKPERVDLAHFVTWRMRRVTIDVRRQLLRSLGVESRGRDFGRAHSKRRLKAGGSGSVGRPMELPDALTVCDERARAILEARDELSAIWPRLRPRLSALELRAVELVAAGDDGPAIATTLGLARPNNVHRLIWATRRKAREESERLRARAQSSQALYYLA